jgi:hypothetical protein
MSGSASVTIPYTDFEAIQTARKAAEREVAELRERIRENKIEASDPTVLLVAREALEVARYAVASLPPESNKGWPARALRVIAEHLPSLPDATQDDHELASTFIYFANEIDLYEKRRRGFDDRIKEFEKTVKSMVKWPIDKPLRYYGSSEPCDMWTGPCSCGATHTEGV